MAPGELPCELAVNPLRQALPRPVCNAVTGLSVAAARLRETTGCISRRHRKRRAAEAALRRSSLLRPEGRKRICRCPANRVGVAKGASIHMTFGAPAQVAVESVEDVEYSAALPGRSHLIVRSLIARAS